MGQGAALSWQRRQFLGATAATAAATLLAGCDAPRVLDGGFTGIDMARGHQLRDLLKSGNLPAPAVQRRTQVLIAGGGVAGLAAARSLRHCSPKARSCRRPAGCSSA